jgi:transglutaminase-like putative cysteine protease
MTYRLVAPASILLAIEPLADAEQAIRWEQLLVNGTALDPLPWRDDGARRRWLHAQPGELAISYRADVEVQRPLIDIAALPATALTDVPPHIAPALFASRYCAPSRFERVLADELGIDPTLPAGGAAIVAMRDWIRDHLAYEPVSTEDTTAEDSFIARAGVCRDFAHLMVAFARAAHVPARFVASYAWQLDPPDFHAVAEVWLDGGWHMIDATGLAPEATLIRIARTQDAVDASFMTIFGEAEMLAQSVQVNAL